MLNNIAIIGNEHISSLEKVVAQEMSTPAAVVTGCFSPKEFEDKVAPVFRISLLDIVLFDATAVNADFLECVRYLKTNLPATTRVIVLYPNLEDEAVIQQLLVYGVFDIVTTHIDKETMDDISIDKQITADIQWAIAEPKTFASIADKLSISVITQTIVKDYVPEEAKEPKTIKAPKLPSLPKKDVVKPRVLGFYTKGKNSDSFSSLEASNRYNVVNVCEASEANILFNDLSVIDIVVFDEVDEDYIAYVKSLVDANQNKTVMLAGYKNAVDMVNVNGVICFTYDSPDNFSRQVSINSVKKDEMGRQVGSHIYAVYGVKGGTGASTLTAIIAKQYAKLNPDQKVLAVDFGLRAGDLGSKFGVALNKENSGNLFACIAAFLKAKAEHNDLELLKSKILDYCHYDNESKVYVLPTSYTDIYRYLNYSASSEDIDFVMQYILDSVKEQFDAIFLDVTKFGGFPFEIAINTADKYILVSDAKLTGITQLLTKYDELHEQKMTDRMAVIVNRSNLRKNENEYDNAKVLEERIDKNRIVYLPFDKTLFTEEDEMDTKCSPALIKELNKVWEAIDYFPKKKKGLFGK